MPLSVALNMINRSMGHEDLYPFVIPAAVLDKLDFVASLARHGLTRPAYARNRAHADERPKRVASRRRHRCHRSSWSVSSSACSSAIARISLVGIVQGGGRARPR